MEATWAEPVLMSASELIVRPNDGWRYELIEGRLVRLSPTGYSHNYVALNLAAEIRAYVRAHGLGVVLGQEAGFLLSRPGEPDTVLAPDVAFIGADRMPPRDFQGYPRLAPDLIAEVISPSQTLTQLRQKAQVWLEHGVRLVWLVIPDTRNAEVWRSRSESRRVEQDGDLHGEDVLPEFRLPLSSLFVP